MKTVQKIVATVITSNQSEVELSYGKQWKLNKQ